MFLMKHKSALGWLIFLMASGGNLYGMGIKKPAAPSAPAYDGSMWLAPNVATPDLHNLFTEPHLWENARARISALQIYGQMLFDQNECPTCEGNTFEQLRNAGLFARLREWGIPLAVEFGAVKPGDCRGEQNATTAARLIRRVSGEGSNIRYISIDEPLTSGYDYCGASSMGPVADDTARFIQSVLGAARSAGNQDLEVGLIEAYPHHSAEQLVAFLRELKNRGAVPSHFHLDFDFWLARNKRLSDGQMGSDFRLLQSVCRELNIPFGVIYWGHDGNSPSSFSSDLLELSSLVRRIFGAPDRVLVQSWAQNSAKRNLNPPVLTESNALSLTGLALKITRGY